MSRTQCEGITKSMRQCRKVATVRWVGANGNPTRYYCAQHSAGVGAMRLLRPFAWEVERIEPETETDRPEPGKVYRLTSGTGTAAISNGNSWAESVVEDEGRTGAPDDSRFGGRFPVVADIATYRERRSIGRDHGHLR